jgi:hypothetical protein
MPTDKPRNRARTKAVRARMVETGENYTTAARRTDELFAQRQAAAAGVADGPTPDAMPDAAVEVA